MTVSAHIINGCLVSSPQDTLIRSLSIEIMVLTMGSTSFKNFVSGIADTVAARVCSFTGSGTNVNAAHQPRDRNLMFAH